MDKAAWKSRRRDGGSYANAYGDRGGRPAIHETTWVREVKPSFVRMCSMWDSTVRLPMTRAVAMSLLLIPCATSSAISCSR
jgi:hypothetical protein